MKALSSVTVGDFLDVQLPGQLHLEGPDIIQKRTITMNHRELAMRLAQPEAPPLASAARAESPAASDPRPPRTRIRARGLGFRIGAEVHGAQQRGAIPEVPER